MRRLLFLDVLKAFAILFVIFVHMQNFLSAPITADYSLFEILKFIPLACFTFASGFAIYENNKTLKDGKEILNFYKKRIVRVYPLYLIALFTFFLSFQVYGLFHPIYYSVPQWIINILCLQVLLAPAFIDPIFSLWFIGLIIVLYAMYPLFSSCSGPLRKKLFLAVSIFTVLAIIHLALNIIDFRYFLYYFFFIAGFVAADKNYYFLFIERLLEKHQNHIVPAIVALSYASYCIYLFHMPIFAITNQFVSTLDLPGYLHNGVILFLVIPIIFCLCYFIQRSYDAQIGSRLIHVWHIRYQSGK